MCAQAKHRQLATLNSKEPQTERSAVLVAAELPRAEPEASEQVGRGGSAPDAQTRKVPAPAHTRCNVISISGVA